MYIYEKYNFRIFTLALALLAFIFLVYSEFIGASVSLFLGILISFSYCGTLIDEKKLRYMKYDRFLWVKIGHWESMSTPSYVTVVRVNVSSLRTLPSPLALPLLLALILEPYVRVEAFFFLFCVTLCSVCFLQ